MSPGAEEDGCSWTLPRRLTNATPLTPATSQDAADSLAFALGF